MRIESGSQPERARTGTTSVYAHTAMPTDMPATAPVRLAPGQNRTPSAAGASWSTATKDTNPIEASE